MEFGEVETTLYYDSESPVLTLTVTPDNATNKDIEWTSSNPDFMQVDATGKLEIVKFAYNEIIKITATNVESGISAFVEFKMAIKKAKIEDYGIIEIKGYEFNDPYNSSKKLKIEFDILDRNIGATKLYDPAGNDEANKASIGDFFQFGNSIPVGTVEGLNMYYEKEAKGTELDWSDAKNTPCPEGWRLLTKEELSLLASAMEIADPYYGGDQSEADMDAAEAFEEKVRIPNSGQYKIDGDTEADRKSNNPVLYLPKAKYLWGGQITMVDGANKTSKRGINTAASFEYNYFPLGTANAEVNTARPLRCAK